MHAIQDIRSYWTAPDAKQGSSVRQVRIRVPGGELWQVTPNA